MTKPQYVKKASAWFIYLLLTAGFHSIIAGWAHAQPVSFVSAKKSAAGLGPFGSSGLGDFNRDGNQDLAMIRQNSNNVSVLLGNGDGTFETTVNFPSGGIPFPFDSLVVSYFNGDSIQDLAVANYNGNISVLLGNGDGTFRAPLDSFVHNNFVTIRDYGDFNSDHLQDLLVTMRFSTGPAIGATAVLLGNGNGTFRAPLKTPVPETESSIVVGYFTDDGIWDIAFVERNQFPPLSVIFVYPGNGDGTFRSAITSPGFENPFKIAVGYFNRDAIADLAVAYPERRDEQPFFVGHTRILLGNGDGSFRSGEDISGPKAFLFNFVDDFNGDTITDLAAQSGLGNLALALGRGDGTFHQLAVSFPVRPFLVGEFNGDGIKDFAGSDDDGILVALSYGDGTFQGIWNYELGPGGATVASGSKTVASGEFNGDGIQDLAVANESPGKISVLLGNGDGSFRWAYDFATTNAASMAVGEFNRDGIQDLVIASPGIVGVLLGNGNGTFQPAVNFPADDNPADIAVGYLNADGFQDLAVVRRNASGISVLLGKGDGTFQAPLFFDTGVPISVTNSARRSIAVGDFNADDRKDLVATNFPATSISVLLGNGDGTFRAPLIFDAGGRAVSVAVGDFNRDQILDLATANNSISGVSVLLGNGNGTFRMPSNIDVGAGANGTDGIAVGDFNSDGIHDIVVTHVRVFSSGVSATGLISVLLGNGNGTFRPPPNFLVGGGSNSLTVGQFSGDGRPDIAVACFEGTIPEPTTVKVSVLINNTP